MRTSFTLLIFLHSVFAPLFSQPVLVKNIKPGNFSGIQLGAARSAVLGNTLYFTAADDMHGVELWKSDGTAAGTVLVRDIYPGKTFDGPDRFYLVHDGQLYFTARDTTHGMELWRTDEGPEGAVLVRDACPGTCSGVFFSAPGPMTAYQGKLYLKWDDYVYGQECWATDGTEAGSSLLKDLYPGAVYSSAPYGFTVFQDKLYFAADSAELGSDIMGQRRDGGRHPAGQKHQYQQLRRLRDGRPGCRGRCFLLLGQKKQRRRPRTLEVGWYGCRHGHGQRHQSGQQHRNAERRTTEQFVMAR